MAICPYCKKNINGDNLIVKEVPRKKMFKLDTEMYSCSHCNAVLGFANSG